MTWLLPPDLRPWPGIRILVFCAAQVKLLSRLSFFAIWKNLDKNTILEGTNKLNPA